MGRWRTVTLGQAAEQLRRYRVFATTLVAILLLALLAPGNLTVRAPAGAESFRTPGSGATDAGTLADGTVAADPTDPGAVGPGEVTERRTSAGGRSTGHASSVAPVLRSSTDAGTQPAPDCDAATGRTMIPSVFAAPCVPMWPKGADNGGATHRGVTKDTIRIALRFGEGNAAVSAILVGAGAQDTREDTRQTREDWIDVFEAHYETYGRRLELVYFEESGDEEAAQRADAVKVANEIKAFAAWGGGDAYADELAARGVVCLCGAESLEQVLRRAPYIWDRPPEGTFYMFADYFAKKVFGRKARFAGDPLFLNQTRRTGLVYSDDGSAQRSIDFLRGRLAAAGAKIDHYIAYEPDINRAQEQARVIIVKLKDAGVTTVVFFGDPIAPIFFTQEATRQAYNPEWVIVGDNLVDTTFFARTYDQTQWQRAFGHSVLWARSPQVEDEVFNLHTWHHGQVPAAEASYEIIYQQPFVFLTAVHLAGPNLTPQTYRDALFSYPPSGGGPTTPLRSWGDGIWPWTDYGNADDSTEVWWDPDAFGQNEVGQDGRGMWRYVDGGRRYRPGKWPVGESNLFADAGTVTKYEHVPPQDVYPTYEHRHIRGNP